MLFAAVLISQIIANLNTFWIVEYFGLFGAREDRFLLTTVNTLITTILVSLPLVLFSISRHRCLEAVAAQAAETARHRRPGEYG